jgi:predicted ATPase
MRIAISGSHATGKSTLILELARRFPELTAIDESSYLLAEQGHAFSDPPTIEDFELLFDHSIATLTAAHSESVIFDRTPADYLAYIAALNKGMPRPDLVDPQSPHLPRSTWWFTSRSSGPTAFMGPRRRDCVVASMRSSER